MTVTHSLIRIAIDMWLSFGRIFSFVATHMRCHCFLRFYFLVLWVSVEEFSTMRKRSSESIATAEIERSITRENSNHRRLWKENLFSSQMCCHPSPPSTREGTMYCILMCVKSNNIAWRCIRMFPFNMRMHYGHKAAVTLASCTRTLKCNATSRPNGASNFTYTNAALASVLNRRGEIIY